MNDRMSISRNVVYGRGGTISYTVTAGNSGNLPQGISGVWVTSTTQAWARLAYVVAGAAPAAVTSDFPINPGAYIWLPAPSNMETGEPLQLSVVRDSASGSAYYVPGV